MLDYCIDANFAIKFDLKKYYYQIKLDETECQYYGFAYSMVDNEPVQYFIWKSLPYGYTRAPFIARELMKPLIAKWRRLGGRVIVFYDDGMAVHKNNETLTALAVQMQCDLLNAGMIPGIEKCAWLPVQVIDWNGLHFDFRSKTLSILDRRIEKLKNIIDDMLSKFPTVSYRQVAKVVGSIVSMSSVFEGLTQKLTKNMQTFLNIRHFDERNWDSLIRANYSGIYTAMYDELNFWKNNVDQYNTRPFVPPPPKWIAWTDASDFALGGLVIELKSVRDIVPCTADNLLIDHTGKYTQLRSRVAVLADAWPWQHGGNVQRDIYDLDTTNVVTSRTCFKTFSPLESAKDSNERELIAILYVVSACQDLFRNSVVTLHTDNSNASIICTKGSAKPRLNKYSVEIASIAMKYNFRLNVIWIPRTLNNLADFISNCQDFSDYSVNRDFLTRCVRISVCGRTLICLQIMRMLNVPVFSVRPTAPAH
jgi:hypothetical protein